MTSRERNHNPETRRRGRTWGLALALGVLGSGGLRAGAATAPIPRAVFLWFQYAGNDRVSETPLPPGHYRNPILAGFYPDPSLCRVGQDYYLVNSSFAYFPGVPVFHSRDLVHWRQIGHVLTRPSQLELRGLQVSRGIFAPTIREHAGTYYMITTLVGGGGNFFVTAPNPSGPWSDPTWLPEIDGIDPSFFFDDDGRAYVVNNGPPVEAPRYPGHRALWMQEFDVKAGRLAGPRQVIVDGGVDITKKPIWIEGPHLFKRNGWYYLMAAEGGTDEGHSEVIFRSRGVRGPFVPWEKNPILTQRTLDPSRPNPVTSTGHADLVETPRGDWWAVFLGCRPYDREARLYDTGRETFLLPVTWVDDWPVILPSNQPVPIVAPAPRLPQGTEAATPLNGNFTWRDEFDGPKLGLAWNFLRTPHEIWHSLTETPGALTVSARADALTGRGEPAFLGRRLQNARFTSSAALRMLPEDGYSAGIVAFQDESHYFYLGVRRRGPSAEIFLERADDPKAEARTVASQAVAPPLPDVLELRIEGGAGAESFSYRAGAGAWTTLRADEDGRILSTASAGGFVGAYVGVYARLEPGGPI